MAQTGVKAMLIDQKSHQTQCGRADGLESRTLEILDSFGLADRVWAEANHTVEIALWVRELFHIPRLFEVDCGLRLSDCLL